MWNPEDSDDEVFMGEISLREVKRTINCCTSKQRQTLSTTYKKTTEDDDKNESIRIIETHSTPDLHSVWSSDAESSIKDNQSTSYKQDTNHDTTEATCYYSVISDNELASHMEPLSYQNTLFSNIDGHGHNPDDSFLQIEKFVTDLTLKTPNKINEKQDEELDNTLDVIEYILKNGPSNDSNLKHADSKSLQEVQETPTAKKQSTCHSEIAKETDALNTQSAIITPVNSVNIMKSSGSKLKTPNTTTSATAKKQSTWHSESAKETDALNTQSAIITPVKTVSSVNIMKSSGSILKTPNTITSAFKTPGYPVSNRKQMLTPLKKQFNHVVSPVASYINDSPVVPLLKNVRPKKPLNGSSFIPQPIKNPSKMNVVNKENQNLPCTAYRSAKKTTVIDYPEEQRLPQSQWARHVASSMQKGVVMRHIHRENNSVKKPLFQQQEDSFSNLTMHQADLSVCTQKSAVKKAF